MVEKKLKLAVPIKGWLVHSDRWSVKDLLRLAGIGEYYKNGKDVHFRSEDPEIEIVPVRSADIPRFVYKHLFEAGITGKDLVYENDPEADNIEFLLDLQCGHVDLAFMASKNLTDALRDSGLKVNLENFLNFLNQTNLKEEGSSECFYGSPTRLVRTFDRPVCITSYPGIAKWCLRGFEKIEKEVIGVKGSCENYVANGIGNFLFETIATGESQRDANLEILEVKASSTAHLIHNYHLCLPVEENRPRYKKLIGLKRKLEEVMEDVDNHCQVRIIFDGRNLSTYGSDILQDNLSSRDSFFDKSLLGICDLHKLERDLFWSNGIDSQVSAFYSYTIPHPQIYVVDRIIPKADLPKINSFISNWKAEGLATKYLRNLSANSEPRKIQLKAAEVFDLKSLYKYCPIISGPSIQQSDLSKFPILCGRRLPSMPVVERVMDGKYPCCDVSKLRPEDREQAIIFSFSQGV